jgi:small conductance mechanosensitive channel
MEKEISAVQKLINTAIEFWVNYSFQVIGAIIVLVAGFIIANWVSGMMIQFFEKQKMDVTLSKFIAGAVRLLILAFAGIIAAGKFGISIAPFVAALSAVAFGTSLALQGVFSNYGAGFGIILGRPFVVGDTITVAGVSGLVHEVKLPCTILMDEDGVKITIPNSKISGEILHNSKAYKIAEPTVGIGKIF